MNLGNISSADGVVPAVEDARSSTPRSQQGRSASSSTPIGSDNVPSDAARWFVPGLLALVVLGALLRVVYALVWENGRVLVGDPAFFQQTAASLSQGEGYAAPFLGRGQPVATAAHPPVFSIVLAILDLLRIQSADAHRIAVGIISAGAVGIMGLLGRRLMGPATGLVAAACAALSPLWIQWGGRLLSESVYLVVIPCMLWVALECVDRARSWMFCAMGIAIGVATLTRSEAILFVILLGVPLVIMGSRMWTRRAMYGLALVAGVLVIVVPWVVRNDIQVGGLVLSTDSGTTWIGAYTADTFSPPSPLYGSVDNAVQFGEAAVLVKYAKPPDHQKKWTELTLNRALGNTGKTFARGHLDDLPGVVLAREGRLWGVYSPETQIDNDSGDGGLVRTFYIAGWLVEWITIPLTLGGAVVLCRRSPRHLLILAAPVVAAAINAAVFFGSTRLRAVAEPSMVLLSSMAIVTIARSIRIRVGRISGAGGALSENRGAASQSPPVPA